MSICINKRECPALATSIYELCIDGIFGNQRYKNTFLMPNKHVCDLIAKITDNDKDEKAIQAIKTLLEYHTKASFKKGTHLGTLNDDHVLANPEELELT